MDKTRLMGGDNLSGQGGNSQTTATGSSFVLSSVKAAWAGPYTVVVKNAAGSVKTPPAVLNVKKPRR